MDDGLIEREITASGAQMLSSELSFLTVIMAAVS